MFIDISVGMLDRDRPLLIPPVRLRHHATVHHGEPIVTPEVDVDGCPIAIVADLFGIQHESSVGASAGDVSLQADLGDCLAIAGGKFLAKLVYVSVVCTR